MGSELRDSGARYADELALQANESVMQGQHRQESLGREFTWHLLQELLSNGFSVFARTLWNFVQPLGQDPILKSRSTAAPLPYVFDDVLNYRKLDHNTAEDIISGISAPVLSIDPSPGAFDRPILGK